MNELYNYNTAINNETLFFCSKFPWARRRISPKFIGKLGTHFKKVRDPALYNRIGAQRTGCG